MDSVDYNPETFVPINKYPGGPYRVFGFSEPEKVLDFSKEAVVDSAKLEEEGGNVEYLTSKSKPTSDKKAKKKYADEWK
jgi:hypothetical protein